MMINNRRLLSVLAVLLLLTTSCATARTVTHFSEGSPLIYSGARLDVHAISKDERVLQMYKEKYGIEPPGYPKLDLPFSFLLDTLVFIPVVLPLPLVLYRAFFE
jgi:uncharacterized protein YceK